MPRHDPHTSAPPAGQALEIRPCRKEDLRPLEWDGAHTADRPVIEQTFARQREGEALMLVATEEEGAPVAQLWLDFAAGDEDTVLVWAVRTRAGRRGRGIGTRLMRAAEREAARRGYRRAELGVEPGNADAIRFYRRLGYAPAGEELATYRSRSPEGEEWRWTVRHVKLARSIRPEEDAPSACAGQSATSRTAGSRR